MIEQKANKAKMNRRVECDYDFIQEKIDRSPHNGSQVSQIIGYSPNWFAGAKSSRAGMKYSDLVQLGMLLRFDPERAIIDKPKPAPPQPKPDPGVAAAVDLGLRPDLQQITERLAENNEAIMAQLKQLNATCGMLLAEFRDFRDGQREIPTSPVDRATEILRKALVGKAGGGIKVKEYQKLLAQAKIATSYMTEAIRLLNCSRVTEHGVEWIIPTRL